MRVAILNRQRAAFPGGDLVAIDATIAALARQGVHAEYAPEGWNSAWLRSFDLAHIYHCNFGWSVYNYEGCLSAGMPFVVTPMFYPTLELGADKQQIGDMLHDARCVMPHTQWELDEIRELVGPVWMTDIEFVPNGTAPEFHAPDCERDERRGVITVTARAGDKNADLVRGHCLALDLPYQEISGVTDRERLAGIYKKARVFVNASGSERMSLTIGEALCAGCRVVATSQNRGNAWYGSRLVTIDPLTATRDQWHSALIRAYLAPDSRWSYAPNAAARQLSWDATAKLQIECYRTAL